MPAIYTLIVFEPEKMTKFKMQKKKKKKKK